MPGIRHKLWHFALSELVSGFFPCLFIKAILDGNKDVGDEKKQLLSLGHPRRGGFTGVPVCCCLLLSVVVVCYGHSFILGMSGCKNGLVVLHFMDKHSLVFCC